MVAASVVVVLVAAGVASGLVAATHRHHTDGVSPPVPVLGSALTPLALYPVVSERGARVMVGEMVVAPAGRPGRTAVLRTEPVTDLHVRYAHVRPVGGDHWQVELLAPGAIVDSPSSARPQLLDSVLDGQAYPVGTVVGSSDGTNFFIRGGPCGMTEAQATSLARSLTTSVTVADCSAAQIAANECT
jgi:hypothetical protein